VGGNLARRERFSELSARAYASVTFMRRRSYMDQILACPACMHTIGAHSADGCQQLSSGSQKCSCSENASDVVEATLRIDDAKRSAAVAEPFRMRAS